MATPVGTEAGPAQPRSRCTRTAAQVRLVATLPAGSVIVELPLGEPAFDVRYMYYSTRHWRRLVNGYWVGCRPALNSSTWRCRISSPGPSVRDAARRPPTGYAVVHDIVHYASDLGGRVRRVADRKRGETEDCVVPHRSRLSVFQSETRP